MKKVLPFILLLAICVVMIIIGCQVTQSVVTGKVFGDPNHTYIVKVPAGSVVAGIKVQGDGVYFSEDILPYIFGQIFEEGLMKGYEEGIKAKSTGKRI